MENGMSGWPRRDWVVALGVALLAALPYLIAGVGGNFIGYDDPESVTANPQVLKGLSLDGARWAFTNFYFASWYPLTWLSHMLDVTLFGLDARGHHATNILLHALNAGLLFLALRRMTGAVWRSAFVAALFGVHPLHVESVAWVAERKDVLSSFFFMLVLLAWERYARLGGARRYLTALVLFALGLMAKPMIVTLPFVLLLLDIWPLGRAPLSRAEGGGARGWGALLLEKVPFLALAAASSAVTLLAKQTGWGQKIWIINPLGERLANAVVAYAAYLADTLWPARLAVHYPFPASIPWTAVAASALLLALLSFAALRRLSTRPYLAVGWCWFVGMLVPVIGFVSAACVARADRWTYLPLIGVFLGAAWLAAECPPASLRRPKVLGPLATGVVAACVAASSVQAGYWRDAETLYRHTLAVTKDNWLFHNNLAALLVGRGQHEEAIRHCREALRLHPHYDDAHNNLGIAYASQLKYEEAIAEYQEAIRLWPYHADARNNLGVTLEKLGRFEGAERSYREAIRIKPDFADAHNNLGVFLAARMRHEEAVVHFRETLRFKPDRADVHYSAGLSLSKLRRFEEAVQSYREAIRITPDYAEAHNNLGVSLALLSRIEEAEQSFREAVRIRPDYDSAYFNLGVSLIEQGRIGEAIQSLREAIRITPDNADAQEMLSNILPAGGSR